MSLKVKKSRLNELRECMGSKDVSLRKSAVKGLRGYKFEEVAPILLQAFDDKHYAVRSAAVEVLGLIGNESVVELMLPLLKDPHYEVRYIVAETLGLFEAKESVIPLIDALKDTDELVRLNAAQSLGILKAKEAIPALTDRLTDPIDLVRAYAAEALGEIGDRRTIDILNNALAKEKRNSARLRILEALYKLGNESNLSPIMRMLNTKSYQVRCAAALILEELANATNASEILTALERRLEKEQTIAVKSRIACCITQLKEHFLK